MRHQKNTPKGKHNHPNKSAAQQQTFFLLLYCKCLLLIVTCNSHGSSLCGRVGGLWFGFFLHVEFACVHSENVESRPRKCGTTKAVRQTPRFSLCRQTLRASLCCVRHISSFWSTSRENQFWEMESLDFVCLGQDGTAWSQWVVGVPPPPLHPTSYWDSESKGIGVSILSWKQTSNIAWWKQEGVWWQCVLKICPTMWYQSVLCANCEKNMYLMCDVIAQYVFLRLFLVLLFMR